jgi:hypothetical protein
VPGAFEDFQGEALAFAARWRGEALANAASLYLAEGKGRDTFKPLVTAEQFTDLLDWSLDRPERFPDKRTAALALAFAVIPEVELGTATVEGRYLVLHGAVEKSLEAQRDLVSDLPDILANVAAGAPRKRGWFSFGRRPQAR